MKTRFSHRTLHLTRSLVAAFAAITIAGCAAQQAYREGNDLVEQDRVEAGLLKLQEAIAKDPGNAQYRAVYLQSRDRTTVRLLQQAELDLSEGRRDAALHAFQRVLAMDALNERGRAGLRSLEAAERLDKLMAAASDLASKKEYEAAKSRLNAVLAENPSHEAARQALKDLNEKTAQSLADTGLSKAYKQPVSIEFRDASLKQTFEVLAQRSGLNFVFDKDVKTDTRVSIFLKNSTVESAVYYLLMTNQLEQQVLDSNTVLIYPNSAAKLKEYQETVIRTFFLANADAKSVANTLKTILKTRDVVVDEKLNLVIVRDSPDAIRLAERLVNVQDVAEPEVMLDVEILEVKRSRLMDLGVAWPQKLAFSPLTTSSGETLTINDINNLSRSGVGVSGLSATVNMNKTDGDTNLLANPRIRVRNKEKARVLIGEKVPVITTTISSGAVGFAGESVSYVDVGLTLNAEPTIYLNNELAIRISLEVSNLVSQVETKSGTKAYQIGTRQAATMLQLKDGENQVLAGLINNEDRSTGSKIPLLGDIPLLGRLFGSTSDDKQKTEIVLSITPHLVRNIQRPDATSAEFSAGTEGNFRRRPDPSVRTPVPLPANATSPGAQLPTQQEPAVGPAPGPNAGLTPVNGVTLAPTSSQGAPLSTTQPGPASTIAPQQPPTPQQQTEHPHRSE